MNYVYAGLIWLLIFFLGLMLGGYPWVGALLLAAIGGVGGAIVTVWLQGERGPITLLGFEEGLDGLPTRPRTRRHHYETLESARRRRAQRLQRRSSLIESLFSARRSR
jgi:hypothetical protein